MARRQQAHRLVQVDHDHRGEEREPHRGHVEAEAHEDADHGRRPDRRRRRQAADVETRPHDDAGAEEADARHDALDHPRGVDQRDGRSVPAEPVARIARDDHQGADPGRSTPLHPQFPRQDHRHQIRRQRDDRRAPEARFRPRRHPAEAGRHEPGRRARRRSADRQRPEENRQARHLRARHAHHRRRNHGSGGVGAGRRSPAGHRHADQPLRRPGRGPDGQGRRPDPRTPDGDAGQGEPGRIPRHRFRRRNRSDQSGRRESAAGRRLHPDHLADRFRPGWPGLQHQCRRRRRQDRGNPESRKADHDDQYRRRAGQERQPGDRPVGTRDRRDVRGRHDFRRHAAENLVGPGRRQVGREHRAHHRWPHRALFVAGSLDRTGFWHYDPLALNFCGVSTAPQKSLPL
eukprot:XP_002534897.2 uncharacterized protein LOC8272894 [Ricinus communis]